MASQMKGNIAKYFMVESPHRFWAPSLTLLWEVSKHNVHMFQLTRIHVTESLLGLLLHCPSLFECKLKHHWNGLLRRFTRSISQAKGNRLIIRIVKQIKRMKIARVPGNPYPLRQIASLGDKIHLHMLLCCILCCICSNGFSPSMV